MPSFLFCRMRYSTCPRSSLLCRQVLPLWLHDHHPPRALQCVMDCYHRVLTWVHFGLLCSYYMHLEARRKSQFKFLDWILKLVWDLFPYAIVALMFAAFLVMNGSIVVGMFIYVMWGQWSNMHVGCLMRCVQSLCVYGVYCTLHSWVNDLTAVCTYGCSSVNCSPSNFLLHLLFTCRGQEPSRGLSSSSSVPLLCSITELLCCPHIIFPLQRVWQFVRSLLAPLRLVVCVVMGGTVCTLVGMYAHVCVCTVFKSWAYIASLPFLLGSG